MSQIPRYDLIIVQDICRYGDLEKIWFSAPSRSLATVIKAYGRSEKTKSYEEAGQFIIQGILALTKDDFVQRTLQWGGPEIADIYGLIFDERPWYVKFVLSEGLLEEISFHPPNEILKTVSGKIIPKEKNCRRKPSSPLARLSLSSPN